MSTDPQNMDNRRAAAGAELAEFAAGQMANQQATAQRINAQVDSAMTAAQEHIAAVGESLTGAGQEAHLSWRAISERAQRLPAVAEAVRQEIAAVAADSTLPLETKRQLIGQLRAVAADRIAQEQEALVKEDLPRFEALLGAESLPVPSKDPGERALRRQEVSGLVPAVRGEGLMPAMLELVGQNPSWDAEMLSDFGQSLFVQRGAASAWPMFRLAALDKLLSNPIGTPRQLANRAALRAYHERKLRGHIAGLGTLSRQRLA